MTNLKPTRRNALLYVLFASALLVLAGCKGGESTEALPNTGNNTTSQTYSGPVALTDDVLNFKREVWDNLAGKDRCGACHNANGTLPQFVDENDVNEAYKQAITVANLNDPSSSRMVTKVGEGPTGHNCWLNSTTACTDILTTYIANWAGGSENSVKTIELRAPAIKKVGAALQFPDSSSDFGATVYPLLETYCAECHGEGGQTPYIASSNIDTAYAESRSRIDLNDSGLSRLVTRLRNDSHNCWNNSCESSANDMEQKIEDFINTLGTPVAPDENMVISRALNLTTDGLAANSGGRFEDNVVALYEFKTGEGQFVYDTSGVSPALDMTLSGNYDWISGWGVEFGPAITEEGLGSGKAQGSTSNSGKLHNLLTLSGEYSLEAWLIPGNITQEDARIITYSGSSDQRNLTFGQDMQSYQAFHRTTESDETMPLITADDDPYLLQATLQHVVVNYTPDNGRQIFVNGQFSEDIDPDNAGSFAEWNDTFALVFGNETDGNSPWQGSLRMVAIHNRALTEEQIQANYDVGVGQKFYLLFSVSHLVNLPESYIVFEVSQFDSSYLFASPFFINLTGLDDIAEPLNVPLEGMRIGVNGQEAPVGQTFANLKLTLNDDDYVAGTGQPLSRMAAVIQGGNEGPESDELFLTFEQLGEFRNVRLEGPDPGPLVSPNLNPVSVIGLKTFDDINASMSRMTGVPTTNNDVFSTYLTVKQQLPTVEDINGFLASHQMAITQMAIQYCDELVNDADLRSSYFPGFNFDSDSNDAFDQTEDLVTAPLINQMIGSGLDTQPLVADVETELDALIGSLATCDYSTPDTTCSERTKTVVKASCAAVLGSAVTLIQ